MRGAVRALELGQSIDVSMEDRTPNSIRNCASIVALQYNRRFTVNANREARTCTITRTA